MDAAGKTSILLLLNRRFSLLSSIKPTFKAKITSQSLSFLGLQVSNWDLGGQKSYRDAYLADPDKYFSDIQSIFFVFDIQARERNDEALRYLKEIVDILNKEKVNDLHFIILFHKLDPDIKDLPEIAENIKILQEQINEIESNFKFSFYKTSIYDEGSLLKAFSDGVITVSHKAKLIQTLLKEYTSKSFNSAAVLLDQQCFIIASRATKDLYQEICESVAPRLTYSIEKLEEWNINTMDIVSNIQFPLANSEEHKEAIIFLRKLDIGNERLYLIALCLNKKVKARSYEFLPLLANNLKNLLESYD